MPQISPTEFYALPLRVHALLADVPLHDVWAVHLPAHRDGVKLSELLGRTNQCGTNKLPPAARALFRLRLFLGGIFRLEAEPKDAPAASFGSRLTPEDRARSLVAPGRGRDCSVLSIVSKMSNYSKYRTVQSMVRCSQPWLKGPMAIAFTLQCMCSKERGSRGSI